MAKLYEKALIDVGGLLYTLSKTKTNIKMLSEYKMPDENSNSNRIEK